MSIERHTLYCGKLVFCFYLFSLRYVVSEAAYAFEVGATTCHACTAGKFAEHEASPVCEACLPGKFSLSSNALSCTACPAGKYASESGMSSCTVCPEGTFFNGTQGTSLAVCETCPEGTYSVLSKDYCTFACPLNTFFNETACEDCPAGTFAPIRGSTQCWDCMDAQDYVINTKSIHDDRLANHMVTQNMTLAEVAETGQFMLSGQYCSVCSEAYNLTHAGFGIWQRHEQQLELSFLGCSTDVSGKLGMCPRRFAPMHTDVWNASVCVECRSGEYVESASQRCTICPEGNFCPLHSEDSFPLQSLRGIVLSQRNVAGLTDFTCRRGYFRSEDRYCCNFNTRYSIESPDCSQCMPGFVYDTGQKECLA